MIVKQGLDKIRKLWKIPGWTWGGGCLAGGAGAGGGVFWFSSTCRDDPQPIFGVLTIRYSFSTFY